MGGVFTCASGGHASDMHSSIRDHIPVTSDTKMTGGNGCLKVKENSLRR